MIKKVTSGQPVGIAMRVGAAACIVALAAASLAAWASAGQSGSGVGIDYHIVATSKTSTMEKELNEAAEKGFHFDAVMGGETAFGGNEVVIAMSRASGTKGGSFGYRLLATSKTSTMQKELQAAADAGFQYRGQTVFNSAFGGDEVVCILERDSAAGNERVDYRLVATSKRARSRRSSCRPAPPATRSSA
jgi:hypothetical protein